MNDAVASSLPIFPWAHATQAREELAERRSVGEAEMVSYLGDTPTQRKVTPAEYLHVRAVSDNFCIVSDLDL